jgi:hypothetical protein
MFTSIIVFDGVSVNANVTLFVSDIMTYMWYFVTAYRVFAMITVVSVKVCIKSRYKLNSLEFSYNRCQLNYKVYCCLPSFTIIHAFY